MEKEFILTKDTLYLLAMVLDSKTLLNLCQVNKRFYQWIGQNENFWSLIRHFIILNCHFAF